VEKKLTLKKVEKKLTLKKVEKKLTLKKVEKKLTLKKAGKRETLRKEGKVTGAIPSHPPVEALLSRNQAQLSLVSPALDGGASREKAVRSISPSLAMTIQ